MSEITNKLIENQNVSGLIVPSDSRIMKTRWIEVRPQSTFTGDAFDSRGLFQFSLGGSDFMICDRSFYLIKDKITMNNNHPSVGSDISPAFNHLGNLFSSMSHSINDQIITETNNYPEVDAYVARTKKTHSFQDSIGKALNLKSSFLERKNDIAADGLTQDLSVIPTTQNPYTLSNLTGTVELKAVGGVVEGTGTLFTTELKVDQSILTSHGNIYNILAITDNTHMNVSTSAIIEAAGTVIRLFNTNTVYKPSRRTYINSHVYFPNALGTIGNSSILPPGRHTISANANVNYKKNCVESSTNKTQGVGVGEFDYEIQDIRFFACVATYAEIPTTPIYKYAFNQVQLIKSKLGNDISSQDHQINVKGNTNIISVALRNTSITDNRYPVSMFKNGNIQDNLTSLRVAYAGQFKPSPDMKINNIGQDDYKRLYVEHVMAMNMFDKSYMSYDEWRELGIIASYQFQKDGSDYRTCDLTLSVGTASASTNILLFAEYTNYIDIVFEKGTTTITNLDYPLKQDQKPFK